MAVDTALKRFSIIHVSSPWRGILPPPDGSVDQPDRYVFPYYYSGIASAEVTGIGFEFTTPGELMEFTVPGELMDFTCPGDLLEFSVPSDT